MSPGQAQNLNPVIVKYYFEKLKQVLEELTLNLQCVSTDYYLDEKGCRLILHRNQYVSAA